MAKRNQYADLVKERFKPKVNIAKRLELQARKVGAPNNSTAPPPPRLAAIKTTARARVP